MKKKIYKRITAAALAVLAAAGSGIAVGSKFISAGEPGQIGNTYYNAKQLAEYNDGLTDWVNGEKVLKAEDKANVLVNIMENKQKLTILEIVPYELASVFGILVPDEEQSQIIEAYGDEIFRDFSILNGDAQYSDVRYLNTNSNNNNIADDEQPITVYSSRISGLSDEQKLEYACTAAQAVADAFLYTNSTTADDVLNAVQSAVGSDAAAAWSAAGSFSKVNSQPGTDGTVSGEIDISVGEMSESVIINGIIVDEYQVDDIQEYIKACVTREILLNVNEETSESEVSSIVRNAAQTAFDDLNMDTSVCNLVIQDWYGPTYSKTDATAYEDGNIRIGFTFNIAVYIHHEHYDETQNNETEFITDVKINKATYDYTAEISNYYLERLLEGYEDTDIYRYYSSGNIEVRTVVGGQLTYDDLYSESDPVDIIYVAGYATDLKGHIYRNAFFQQPVEDAETAVNFMKNGDAEAADELFDTNVYHIVDGEYVEYTFSELVDNQVWYDSYSKVGSQYVPNELSWNSVKLIMEYVFGEYNTNYKHVYYDDDGTEHSQIQRVSCMYQVSAFARSGSAAADNNMAKLYFLLCKTTDQPDTTALDKDIKTYYRDPDYFYKKYFSETKDDGTPYTYENGVTTAAYNGDVNWTVYYSAQQDVKWFLFEVTDATKLSERAASLFDRLTSEELADFNSQLASDGSMWILNDTMDYYLFLTSWCNDGRYIPYNGVVGLFNRNGVDLLKPSTDMNWSDSGARLPGVTNRFDSDDYTTISINNYFLGIDETDFITKPDALFTDAEFGMDSDVNSVNAEMASNRNAFVVYMYESGVYYDDITINYRAADSNGKLVSGVLAAHYKVLEDGMYTDKTVTVKEYDEALLAGRTEFTDYFVIDRETQPELYDAFMNKTLSFTFTVQNETEGKNKVYTLSDTAYLYFVYRQLKDLD